MNPHTGQHPRCDSSSIPAISGLLWLGTPRKPLELSIDGAVTLCRSAALLDELAATLPRPKFAGRIEAFGTSATAPVVHDTGLVRLAFPSTVRRVVAGDADDDHVFPIKPGGTSGLTCVAPELHSQHARREDRRVSRMD